MPGASRTTATILAAGKLPAPCTRSWPAVSVQGRTRKLSSDSCAWPAKVICQPNPGTDTAGKVRVLPSDWCRCADVRLACAARHPGPGPTQAVQRGQQVHPEQPGLYTPVEVVHGRRDAQTLRILMSRTAVHLPANGFLSLSRRALDSAAAPSDAIRAKACATRSRASAAVRSASPSDDRSGPVR